MTRQDTDLTFFTNDAHGTLLDRFTATLTDTQFFDVLVGYFRASGFYQLQNSMASIEKTRILVGLGVDGITHAAVQGQNSQSELDFESHKRAREIYQDSLVRDIETSEQEDAKLEQGLQGFIAFLNTPCLHAEEDILQGGNGKKLEIRAYPTRNLHAKVYIGRFNPKDRDFGFVITGSSNFSHSGLIANREFNVELRQRRDVDFALSQFEALWRESVQLSQTFVDAVQKRTWINDTITPYQLYLKLIYEYLQEDINLQDTIDIFLPEGFLPLQYQKQAVQQALKKLKEHNGVFLADVVGLGKTFITAQLLQQLKGRILVVCPPVLRTYWEESLHDFRVPARVESLGKLDRLLQAGYGQVDYVVVDEAHRFRNEGTQSYAHLLEICRGKKVILVTATPLNNSIDDIYAQLKLFQQPKNATIPGIPNLERFFAKLRTRFKGLDRSHPTYPLVVREVSREIRERILKHIMVRRTRRDVVTYFPNDTQQQGLFFPEIMDPRRITYQFEGRLEGVFSQTMSLLLEFRYTRYVPLLYYIGKRRLSEFERQQQRNVGGFMKSLLIKRLESSFFAFRKSIARFIHSYQRFIAMAETGTLYISKDVDVFDLLDSDAVDTLENLVAENKAQKYAVTDFRDDFLTDLHHDHQILGSILSLWESVGEDPKLAALQEQLESDAVLQKRLILFTESKETGDYLFENLNQRYPGKVLFFSSTGGRSGSPAVTHQPNLARDAIQAAFDPNHKNPDHQLRILISTDVLAEGINLHRGNVLINYDLPWNPTRVLQRAGRINRLGTDHPNLYIYNFFPTSQADSHLGLEANITNKIQMFHDLLGEDAKYLSEGEVIGSQELFDTLNRKQAYSGEDVEGDSELAYLELMRRLRDQDPQLFEKIKRLPKKARSGRQDAAMKSEQLVTFFRVGALKKFYTTQAGKSHELTFFEAAQRLECDPDTARHPIPATYFHMLETNKQRFALDAKQAEEPVATPRGGSSNLAYLMRRLKDKSMRHCEKFTDSDEAFLKEVRNMVDQGLVAKKTAQTLKKDLEKVYDPLKTLAILRKHLHISTSTEPTISRTQTQPREIILSGYLLPTAKD